VLTGNVQTEGGCASISDSSQTRWEVVWPPGFEIEFDPDGLVRLNEADEPVAALGDTIGLDGERDPSDLGSTCMIGRMFQADRVVFVASLMDWMSCTGVDELTCRSVAAWVEREVDAELDVVEVSNSAACGGGQPCIPGGASLLAGATAVTEDGQTLRFNLVEIDGERQLLSEQ
jgi:hypothetical protein